MKSFYKNKKRIFGIPYNFDPKLLVGLNILDLDDTDIGCIYLPPYEFDYPSMRRNDIMPDEKSHLSQIEIIQKQFPGKIQLLLQQPNNNYIMKDNLLDKYIKLGIKKFCVGSLEQAEEIKNILPEAEIIGSISMRITKEKINNNIKIFKQYFNSFTLDYSYTKNLNKIKEMPLDFKYVLIPNSLCNINCDCDFHWFNNDYKNFKCPYQFITDIDEIATINPILLKNYDPYIYYYKIVERGSPTKDILRDLILYNIDFDFYE